MPQGGRFADTIATPGELAAALRRAGLEVRETPGRKFDLHTETRICHGGDSADKLGLAYDLKRRLWTGHCLTGGCTQAAILHGVQEATGLAVCRCEQCFQAWRESAQTGAYPRFTPNITRSQPNKAPESRSKRKSGQNRGGDTAAYAARLWEAARVSTGAMQADHPVARWLADRALWPPGVQLPDGVRWLPRTAHCFPRGRPDSTAAGALVLAMRLQDDPLGPVRKVQLVAVGADGGKAQHWTDGDKRTYGQTPAYGLLTHWQLTGTQGYDLHVCEGLADGLAILSGLPYRERAAALGKTGWEYARAGYVMAAVCAGTGYGGINPDLFDKVTLWPDADRAGIEAARKTAQWWADLGRRVEIKLLPDGYDPAQYAGRRI